jgi:ribosomal protein L22
MSADEDKDVPGDTPEEPKAAKKPAAKKPAAKKQAAKKPAAAKPTRKAAAKPTAETTAGEQPAASAQPAAKKPAAKKPAAKRAAKKTAAEPTAKAATGEASKPAAKRRRAGGEPKAPPRRVVRARARYVRTSARKARMVCGHLRGKSVQEARAILAFTPREVAGDWRKLLESAVANAESNHELLEDDLIVREAYADEGPTIKRFRPRAMGRATPIRKRTSHLTITLTPRPQAGAGKRNG